MWKNFLPLCILGLGFVCSTYGQGAIPPAGLPGTPNPLGASGAPNASAVPEAPAAAGNGTESPIGALGSSVAPVPAIGNNATAVEPPGPGLNATEPAVPLGGNGTEPAIPGGNATEPVGPVEAEPGANATAPSGGLGGENGTAPGSEAPAAAVSGHGETKEGELPPADEVKFFFVGFRHGNRNPAQFLKNDTTHDTWAWEGTSQLTSIGRRQASALGQFLRKRYGHLVPEEYYPTKIKAWSSSAERSQQTLQSVMLGFYPPVWKKSLLWQPVPYDINDPLLRMYNIDCPEYTSAYKPISEDSGKGADAWLKKEDPELLKYISENSGLNASLSDLADVADNIGNMRLFNVPFPDWVSNPTLKGYSAKRMFEAIMSFAEAHQVLCADDSACAQMMAGHWLDQIIQTLAQVQKGALKGRLANFYAAHTETVLSLIRLVKAKDVKETPTSAGFILEYKDSPEPAVRFIFHEPDANNPDIRLAEVKQLKFAGEFVWIPLDRFVEAVKAPAFKDWQTTCKSAKCPV